MHELQGVLDVASKDAQCISRYWLQVDMSQIYASEWHRTLWRTKRSDFESVVYRFRLVFPVPHLTLTSDYHQEF